MSLRWDSRTHYEFFLYIWIYWFIILLWRWNGWGSERSVLFIIPFSIFFNLKFLIFRKDFIYLFLERVDGKEKEGEKHQGVVASQAPPCWGPGPQPRHVPWLGIELASLWFAGPCSVHWATPARASSCILKLDKNIYPEKESMLSIIPVHMFDKFQHFCSVEIIGL